MATLNLVPRATGEGEIGLSNKKWSQAHFTTGNFDNLNIGGNTLNENVDDRVNALLVAGSGITKTYDDTAGTLTLTASGGSASNSFATISVSGQSDVVADSSTDTLTLVAGSNITLTTDAASDQITIAASGSSGGSRTEPILITATSHTIGSTSSPDSAIGASEIERAYFFNNGNAVTVTLPNVAAQSLNGFKLQIKRIGAGAITINGANPNPQQNIDGSASLSLNSQYESVTLLSDGADWYII